MSGVFGDRHPPQDIEFDAENENPVTMIDETNGRRSTMDPSRVLALVLAGGNGTRLHPLSAEHAASMPLIFGIGISPLLQWLILPPILVLAYRSLEPVLFGRHSSSSPIPTHDGTRGQR